MDQINDIVMLLKIYKHANVWKRLSWDDATKQCCSEKLNKMDPKIILTCSNVYEGNQLVHKAAQATSSDHKYVPWITVNGKHIPKDEAAITANVFKWAFTNYTGSDKPAGCNLFEETSNTIKIEYCQVMTGARFLILEDQ